MGRSCSLAMLTDHRQLDASGIRPLASAKRLQQEAYRAWFAGIACNAIAGFYTLWQLRQKEQTLDKNEGEGVVESKKLIRQVFSLRLMLPSKENTDCYRQNKKCHKSPANLRSM